MKMECKNKTRNKLLSPRTAVLTSNGEYKQKYVL